MGLNTYGKSTYAFSSTSPSRCWWCHGVWTLVSPTPPRGQRMRSPWRFFLHHPTDHYNAPCHVQILFFDLLLSPNAIQIEKFMMKFCLHPFHLPSFILSMESVVLQWDLANPSINELGNLCASFCVSIQLVSCGWGFRRGQDCQYVTSESSMILSPETWEATNVSLSEVRTRYMQHKYVVCDCCFYWTL